MNTGEFDLMAHIRARAGLRDGSQVRIGNTTMTVRVVEDAEPGGAVV